VEFLVAGEVYDSPNQVTVATVDPDNPGQGADPAATSYDNSTWTNTTNTSGGNGTTIPGILVCLNTSDPESVSIVYEYNIYPDTYAAEGSAGTEQAITIGSGTDRYDTYGLFYSDATDRLYIPVHAIDNQNHGIMIYDVSTPASTPTLLLSDKFNTSGQQNRIQGIRLDSTERYVYMGDWGNVSPVTAAVHVMRISADGKDLTDYYERFALSATGVADVEGVHMQVIDDTKLAVTAAANAGANGAYFYILDTSSPSTGLSVTGTLELDAAASLSICKPCGIAINPDNDTAWVYVADDGTGVGVLKLDISTPATPAYSSKQNLDTVADPALGEPIGYVANDRGGADYLVCMTAGTVIKTLNPSTLATIDEVATAEDCETIGFAGGPTSPRQGSVITESWSLEYSQDYGLTWTTVDAAIKTASYTWDTSGFVAGDEGTFILRARLYNADAGSYTDYTFSSFYWDPSDREAAGTDLWNESDDKRVTAGAPFDLNEWTDVPIDAGDSSWDGSWTTGHITNHATFASTMDQGTLGLTAIGTKQPTTVEAACEVMHSHDGGGFPWMEYWDIENSFAGLAIMASGTGESDKNGIFINFGSLTLDAYGTTYPEGSGLVDFWVECWQGGVRKHNYVRGPTLSQASQMGEVSAVVYDLAGTTNDLKPRYEVLVKITTTAVYADGSRDLRIRAALFGRGIDAPDVSPGWHIDTTWEGAKIPAGYFGYTGNHDSLSSAVGVGMRSFSELTVVIDSTPVVEPPPGSEGSGTSAAPGLCPSPDNEKLRYLDRRVSLDTTGVSAAYDSGTDTTTWTLPYTVATDGSEGTMAVAREDTLVWYTAKRPASNQVSVSGYGDLSLTAVFIGVLYCFQFDPLRPYLREQSGQVDDRGRLTVNYIDVQYHETTDLTATASIGLGRSNVQKVVKQNVTGDGLLRIPIMARNERVNLSLTNCTPGGCKISTMEYEAKLTQRSRRV
jgi:hypothetical protein